MIKSTLSRCHGTTLYADWLTWQKVRLKFLKKRTEFYVNESDYQVTYLNPYSDNTEGFNCSHHIFYLMGAY